MSEVKMTQQEMKQCMQHVLSSLETKAGDPGFAQAGNALYGRRDDTALPRPIRTS